MDIKRYTKVSTLFNLFNNIPAGCFVFWNVLAQHTAYRHSSLTQRLVPYSYHAQTHLFTEWGSIKRMIHDHVLGTPNDINPKQPKCLTNCLLLWKARCQYAQWRAIQFCQSSYASPFSANTESPWKATIQWNWVGLCGFGRCNIFMIIHAYLAYWVLYIIVYPHIDSVISVESFLKTCAPWQVLEYFREVSGSMCAFYLQLGYTDNLFPSIYIVVSLYQDMYIYPHTHVNIVDLIKDQLVGLLLLDGADRVFVPLKKEDDSEPLAAYAFLALCWVMWRP